MTSDLKRINKYLADRGLCSRREADDFIKRGLVSVNGQVLTDLSYRVKKDDQVKVDLQVQKELSEKKTLIIHKPVGYVSAQAEEDYVPAIRLVVEENYYGSKRPERIEYQGFAPAGRLDIDSTGLLILTQNGKLAKTIISPDSVVEKEYIVTVEGKIDPKKIDRLRHGLSLDGRKLKPAHVRHVETQVLEFILKEGRKRQIRRMCELVDLKVTHLKRVRIGQIHLGDLPLGHWRFLQKGERV